MVLEEFVKTCKKLGITLDTGYVLYRNYQNGYGHIASLDTSVYNQLIVAEIIVNSKLSRNAKELFETAEKASGGDTFDKSKAKKQATAKIINPIKIKEMKPSPLLDTIVEALYGILITEDIAKSAEHKKLQDRLHKGFNNCGEIIKFYTIWHYLWPAQKESYNQSWADLYQVRYDNVPLRIDTEGKRADFKYMVAKLDARIYLLTTFLFIKSGVKYAEKKTFIKKYERFKTERDHWVEYTLGLITDQGDSIINVFDPNFNLANSSNAQESYISGITV